MTAGAKQPFIKPSVGSPLARIRSLVSPLLFLREDQVIGPSQNLVQAGCQKPADVRDGLKNEVAIGSINLIQANMRIKHLNLPALSDQLFQKSHHRALAQVVGVFFERQPDHPDALRRPNRERREWRV